mmetsp:Transcript_52019/g.120887  ORF Transcript_52019/g.120887 Transcript_52019/m.120887 type:complete len:291 (+) Transcript_52019:265-1137(+)
MRNRPPGSRAHISLSSVRGDEESAVVRCNGRLKLRFSPLQAHSSHATRQSSESSRFEMSSASAGMLAAASPSSRIFASTLSRRPRRPCSSWSARVAAASACTESSCHIEVIRDSLRLSSSATMASIASASLLCTCCICRSSCSNLPSRSERKSSVSFWTSAASLNVVCCTGLDRTGSTWPDTSSNATLSSSCPTRSSKSTAWASLEPTRRPSRLLRRSVADIAARRASSERCWHFSSTKAGARAGSSAKSEPEDLLLPASAARSSRASMAAICSSIALPVRVSDKEKSME